MLVKQQILFLVLPLFFLNCRIFYESFVRKYFLILVRAILLGVARSVQNCTFPECQEGLKIFYKTWVFHNKKCGKCGKPHGQAL